MKKLQTIVCVELLLPSLNGTVYAQTEKENLVKYWNYRDKFRKFFIKNGTSFGEGMPAATVYKNVPCPNAPRG